MDRTTHKSTVAEQIARFRAAAPSSKEERNAEKAFWWMSSSRGNGDAPAAGQLPRTITCGIQPPSGKTPAVPRRTGRFIITEEPNSNNISVEFTPVDSNVPGRTQSTNQPGLDALQQLLARNPNLLKALTELERDEHGKISETTLERIRAALDGNADTPQHASQPDALSIQHSPAVPHQAHPTPQPAVTSSNTSTTDAQSKAHELGYKVADARSSNQVLAADELTCKVAAHQAAAAAEAAACSSVLVGAAQVTSQHAPGAAGSAQSTTTVPVVPAGSQCSAGSASKALVLSTNKLQPAVDSATVCYKTTSTEALGSCNPCVTLSAFTEHSRGVASAESPIASKTGRPPGSSSPGNPAASSGCGSRRESLRLSLSIDVDQRASSSSSSGTDDNSSESDTAAASVHNSPGHDSSTEVAEQQLPTRSSCSSEDCKSNDVVIPREEHAMRPEQQETSEDGASSTSTVSGRLQDSSKAGGHVNKHDSTAPDFMLHGAVNIFSRSVIDSDKGSSGDEGPYSNNNNCQQCSIQKDLQHLDDGEEVQQRYSHQMLQKLSKRPPTPGACLGKPTSILCGGCSAVNSSCLLPRGSEGGCGSLKRPKTATISEGRQQQQKQVEGNIATTRQGCSKKQQWRHKLSKRPPTPGVPLGKPVSIFHSAGACSPQQCQYTDGKASRPGSAPLESSGLASDEGWTQHSSCVQSTVQDNSSQARAGSREQQQQQQQGRHAKLSRRPPTPGASLGKPVSIFSGSGGPGSGNISGSSGLINNRSINCGPSKDEGHADSGHHQVQFSQLDYFQRSSDEEEGQDENGCLVRFSDDATQASQAAAQITVRQRRQQPGNMAPNREPGLQQQQHWQHKLSNRPPTPAAGVGQPVSIFRDDSGIACHSNSAVKGSSTLSARPASAGCYVSSPSSSKRQCQQSSSRRDGNSQHAEERQRCVVFKQELLHFSDLPKPFNQAGKCQLQQRPKQNRQRWARKLSQRPPTPGAGLGQPVSIFKHPDAVEADYQAGELQNERQHALEGECGAAFAQNAVRHAAAAATVVDCEEPRLRSATEPGGRRHPPCPQQQQQTDKPKHWHHKLSRRPPTPGVSLGKPVSIFSSSGTDSDTQPNVSAFSAPGWTTTTAQVVAVAALPGAAVIKGPSFAAMLAKHNSDLAVDLQETEGVQSAAAVADELACASSGVRTFSGRINEDDVNTTASTSEGSHDRRASQLHKRALTPGTGLKQPVSIFRDGNTTMRISNSSPARADSSAALVEQTGDMLVSNPGDNTAAHMVQFQNPEVQWAARSSQVSRSSSDSETAVQQHQQGRLRVSFIDELDAHAQEQLQHQQQCRVSITSDQDEGVDRSQQQQHRCRVPFKDDCPGEGCEGASKPNCQQQHTSHRVPFHDEQIVANAHSQQLVQQEQLQRASRRVSFGGEQDGLVVGRTVYFADEDSSSTAMQQAAVLSTVGQHVVPAAVAAPVQHERCQKLSAKHPSTPGLALMKPHLCITNAVFEDDDECADAGQQSTSPEPQSVTSAASSPGAAGGVSQAGVGPVVLTRPAQQHSQQLEEPHKASLQCQQPLLQHSIKASSEQQEEQQQEEQQQTAAKHSTAPGAALGSSASRFCNDVEEQQQQQQLQALTGAEAAGHLTATVAFEKPTGADRDVGSGTSIQNALLQHNPELALEKQTQEQQRISKHATTPGAALAGHVSIFMDDNNSKQHNKQRPAETAHYVGSRESDATSVGPNGGNLQQTKRTSLQAALLLHNADLALEQQSQKERKMSKHPTTPGAGLGKHVSIFDAGDRDGEAQPQQQLVQQQPAQPRYAAQAVSDDQARGNVAPTSMQALLSHNADLALEQQSQQERKLTKVPTTPGAGLGKPLSVFRDDDESKHPAAAGVSIGPSSSVPGQPTRTSIQAALLLRNADLALEEQNQQERKMSKHATTPGAGLGKHFSMFKDEDSNGEVGHQQHQQQAACSSNAASADIGRTSSSSSKRTSIQAALLLHNADLALEEQNQQERKMSKYPTTPGAGLGKHCNMFKDNASEGKENADNDADDEHQQEVCQIMLARPVHSTSTQQQDPHDRASAVSAAVVQEVIVSHNPELALEKQTQLERRMKKVPTTPGAGLGKPFNMFKDDSDESDSCASNSLANSPRKPVPAGSNTPNHCKHDPTGKAVSPISSNSSTMGVRAPSPDMMAAVRQSGISATSAEPVSRPGSINPERHRSYSASTSPLRRSSGSADPDPSRLSPLGHGKAVGSSAVSTGATAKCPAALSVDVHSASADSMHQTGSSRLSRSSSPSQSSSPPAATVGVAAPDPTSPVHSPSRLSRSTSPAAGMDASKPASPSPLRRSSTSFPDNNPLAGGPASAPFCSRLENLSDLAPKVAPDSAGTSPSAPVSSSVSPSSLARSSIGGSASPLRHSTSAADPVLSRASPLRRESSATAVGGGNSSMLGSDSSVSHSSVGALE